MITKLTADVENIKNMPDRATESDGYSAKTNKAKFDKAGVDIKAYINETLTEELDTKFTNIDNNNNSVVSQLSDIVQVNVENFKLNAPETDDTARINRAIQSLRAGDTLLFPNEKTYTISDELLVTTSNITMFGNATITQTSPTKDIFQFASGVSNVKIEGINLIGSAIRANYYPTESVGLRFVGNNNNIHVFRVTATTLNVGIEFNSGNNVIVEKCNISNMIQFDGSQQGSDVTSGYGVQARGTTSLRIVNNNIQADRHCVYLGNLNESNPVIGYVCDDVIVESNTLTGDNSYKTFQSTYEYVLKIRGGGDIKVFNNIINDGYGGILVSTRTVGIIEIKGNLIRQKSSYTFTGTHNNSGIHVDSTGNTAPCEHVVIENNTIKNLSNCNGVFIDNTKIVEFKNNRIINCVRTGYFRPDPNVNKLTAFVKDNYFDNSGNLQFLDLNSNGIEYINLENNEFSNNMFSSNVIFGTLSKANVKAFKNRVLSGANGTGYEIPLKGAVEVNTVGIRYYNINDSATYINAGLSGTTANRPTLRYTGMPYYDITLGKPIFYSGSGNTWVDATGEIV